MRYLLKNDTDIQFIFSQRDFNKIDVETIFDILERTKLENTKDVMKIVGSKNIDRLPFYRLCLLADSKNIYVYDYLKLIK
jgi:hypothetical protein